MPVHFLLQLGAAAGRELASGGDEPRQEGHVAVVRLRHGLRIANLLHHIRLHSLRRPRRVRIQVLCTYGLV